MRTVVTVVAFFAIAATVAVLIAIGRPEWAAIAWVAVLAIGAAAAVIRVVRGRSVRAGNAIGRAGQAQSDILTGVTYTGPRLPSPPLQQVTELVVEPDPDAPSRNERDGA